MFWVYLFSYMLIGFVAAKITYNKTFDQVYLETIPAYVAAGSDKDAAQENAYNRAENSGQPIGYAVTTFLIWPVVLVVVLFYAGMNMLSNALIKIAPTQAYKDKVIRDAAKARKAELAEYEKALKVLED